LPACESSCPEDQAPQVEEFVRQYYGWVSSRRFERALPGDVYGAAVAHWNFARQREPGSAKIRVYNPRFEEHGWQSTHTVVEMVNDDMPFLVDSTRMGINRQGYGIHLMLHPVMKVRRDPEGRLVEILDPASDDEDAISESVIHVEVDRQTEPEVLEQLRECIEKVLGDVRAAVEDWPRMREKARGTASGLGEEEAPPDGGEQTRRSQGVSGVDLQRQLHLPGLPRLRLTRAKRGGRAPFRTGLRSRRPAGDEPTARVAELRQATP
jgi:glutamate dehydrogenase